MSETKAFKELFASVSESYLGKPVPKQYQKLYGKKYSSKDVQQVAIAIAKSKGWKI